MYIKKHGGFPLNGGGLRAIVFKHNDVQFIAKIVNELDMSDENYYYALSTVQCYYEKEDASKKILENAPKRILMMKKLLNDLKKITLNKFIAYKAGYIYINQHGIK